MLKRLVAAASALLVTSAAVSEVDRWKFGPFSIDAIPGYSYREGRSPAVYANASGSAVLITVHLIQGMPTAEELPKIARNAVQMARSTFERGADKYGRVVRPFSEEQLPSGDKLVSLHVETKEATGPGYLLQFAVISKTGHIAIITIEGPGSVQGGLDAAVPTIRTAHFAG